MKQFIICPNCGSIELAEIQEWIIHTCSKCNYIIMESEWNAAKAVSIRQPWPILIGIGLKPIENRTWPTKFRGRVLTHSGAQYDSRHRAMDQLFTPQQWEAIKQFGGKDLLNKMLFSQFDRSCITGSVEIVDCVQNYPSIWAEPDCWHWVLKDPILFEEPIMNVKGKLSFFIPEII